MAEGSADVRGEGFQDSSVFSGSAEPAESRPGAEGRQCSMSKAGERASEQAGSTPPVTRETGNGPSRASTGHLACAPTPFL